MTSPPSRRAKARKWKKQAKARKLKRLAEELQSQLSTPSPSNPSGVSVAPTQPSTFPDASGFGCPKSSQKKARRRLPREGRSEPDSWCPICYCTYLNDSMKPDIQTSPEQEYAQGLEKPVTLPCRHAVGESCLALLATDKCPFCRKWFSYAAVSKRKESRSEARSRWRGAKKVKPEIRGLWEICETIWTLIVVALCVCVLYWLLIEAWGWVFVVSTETAHETPLTENADNDLTMT